MAFLDGPVTTSNPTFTDTASPPISMQELSVVVPVRNAEACAETCLSSIAAAHPREIIVVDGRSTDRTLEIARRYTNQILCDEGQGLPVARLMGVQAARSRWVALIDADVVLPGGALQELLVEFASGGYTALQAGLESVADDGYWGQALAHHHRTGRSKTWFGVAATIFEREAMLKHGFDARFISGEDMELRWRLRDAGLKVGVSQQTFVVHRFADNSFTFARDQWLMDGKGLGRMVRKHGLRGSWLVLLPLLASTRGIALSLTKWRQPHWIPYFALYGAFNYVGMFNTLTTGGLTRSVEEK